MIGRLRHWLIELWWSYGRTRCYSCRRWFRPNDFWNPWDGKKLTSGVVHRLHAEGKLTSIEAAAASIAVTRGHGGLCCSEDCCEAARAGSTQDFWRPAGSEKMGSAMTCNDDKQPDFPPWSVGDREPPLQVTIYQADGITPLDLTGKTVAFEMQLVNRTGSVISGAATVVGDPTLGVVKYAWAVGNLAVAGDYDAELIITYADTTQQTYPSSPWRIQVRARV